MKRSRWVLAGLLLLGVVSCVVIFSLAKPTPPPSVDRNGEWCCQVVKDGDSRSLSRDETRDLVDLYNEVAMLSWNTSNKQKLTTKTGPDYRVLFLKRDATGATEDTASFLILVYMPKMLDVGDGLFEAKGEVIKRITDAIKAKWADADAKEGTQRPG